MSYSNCNAQFEDSYQETGVVSDANYELINEMVATFENQICKYYGIKPEKASLAFYKYTQDLKNSNIDIKILTSKRTNELLKKSIKNLLGYIWITNKDKRTRWNLKNRGGEEIKYQNPESKIVQEYIQELKATENILNINYHTDFISNIIKNTYIKDLKDIIFTLKDKYENDSPSLTAIGLSSIKKEDFNDSSLKKFIAFELFYATLNTIKNE